MFDYWQPSLPAHLCDRCRYVTFNDPDENGLFFCNVCGPRCDECQGSGATKQGWTDKNGYPEDQYGPCRTCKGEGHVK